MLVLGLRNCSPPIVVSLYVKSAFLLFLFGYFVIEAVLQIACRTEAIVEYNSEYLHYSFDIGMGTVVELQSTNFLSFFVEIDLQLKN